MFNTLMRQVFAGCDAALARANNKCVDPFHSIAFSVPA
jgi:hypothetical protein